jgi:hypothetical protein
MIALGTRVVLVSALALLAALAMLTAIGTAEAAFPGTSGKIAYHRAFDYFAKNASLGSQEAKLFDDAAYLTYSPDGSRVAFVRGNEIYVANADGTGTPRNLTNSPLLDGNPAWSHDGSRIAFQRRGIDNIYNIWTINADGTGQRQLTAELSSSPAWSVPVAGAPDGRIAFVRGGKIWTMLANGTGEAALSYDCPTENGGFCDNAVGNPTFSPDGSQIAAEYFGDIFVIPSVGGTARTILPGPNNKYPGQELDPAWSPDGTKIAFEHNGNVPGSPYGIYMANADGSSAQATQLTSKTGEVDPDWQPAPACTNTGATAGNDTINGTPGKDVLCGLGGNDTIKGLDGNDILLGGPGNDTLGGGLGNDIDNGGSGADTANYSTSATRIIASLATELATGEGTDTFSGVERLSGSGLADTLTGSVGANILKGLGGNDTLRARDGVGGNDTVDGGAGSNDTCQKDAGDAARNCP